jgi:hypothetical protein
MHTEQPSRITASPILYCTAPYAKLRFGKRVNSETGTDTRVTLRDGDEDIGILNLQTRARSVLEIFGRSCELIALSEAETAQPKRLAELDWARVAIFEDDTKKLKDQVGRQTYEGIYCFYNVMWIKWVGGVAERRTLGHRTQRRLGCSGTQEHQVQAWVILTTCPYSSNQVFPAVTNSVLYAHQYIPIAIASLEKTLSVP